MFPIFSSVMASVRVKEAVKPERSRATWTAPERRYSAPALRDWAMVSAPGSERCRGAKAPAAVEVVGDDLGEGLAGGGWFGRRRVQRRFGRGAIVRW